MEEVEDSAPSLVDLLQTTAKERRVLAPNLSSTDAGAYLDHLLSLPLQSLLAEASIITSEATAVESELINLCFREYPTFISVHKCSSAVTSAFDDFSSSLGRLLDAVPALEEECRNFVKGTTGVQNARAKAALVQEHQDKLSDLLEIPQLMDTCVRNGYFQEALELSSHTNSLLLRYPAVELVQDVAKEVDGVLQLMLAQLLALLREPIKLAALVKTVGYLRRLGTVEESELGLVFLISRLSNFRVHLITLERDRADPVRYIRKYIDLFREHVFDIISQFTAIFLDGAQLSIAAGQLASFVGQCVDDLVELVAKYVPRMSADAASLSSVLVQLGYCALAFARVGLDFSALITEPFSATIVSVFSQSVESASTALSSTFTQAIKVAGNPSQVLVAHDFIPILLSSESPKNFVMWDSAVDHPPADLTRFPPLAIFVNAHLSALNSLRLLAPLHIYPRLAAVQSSVLRNCTSALTKYVQQAIALSDPVNGQTNDGSRETSGRPSSPRAHLIRRNSETQLSPEARSAKRREAQWVCTAFADAWVNVVCPLLADILDLGVYGGSVKTAVITTALQQELDALSAWINDQVEEKAKSIPNGTAIGGFQAPNGESGSWTPQPIPEEEVVEATDKVLEDLTISSPDAVETRTLEDTEHIAAVTEQSDIAIRTEDIGQAVPTIVDAPSTPATDIESRSEAPTGQAVPTIIDEPSLPATDIESRSEAPTSQAVPTIIDEPSLPATDIETRSEAPTSQAVPTIIDEPSISATDIEKLSEAPVSPGASTEDVSLPLDDVHLTEDAKASSHLDVEAEILNESDPSDDISRPPSMAQLTDDAHQEATTIIEAPAMPAPEEKTLSDSPTSKEALSGDVILSSELISPSENVQKSSPIVVPTTMPGDTEPTAPTASETDKPIPTEDASSGLQPIVDRSLIPEIDEKALSEESTSNVNPNDDTTQSLDTIPTPEADEDLGAEPEPEPAPEPEPEPEVEPIAESEAVSLNPSRAPSPSSIELPARTNAGGAGVGGGKKKKKKKKGGK